ncbi:MAG: flagellar basal body-associated protein FliL [Campylobacterales bacterium]|nr:flagellar basal body-associated protein FliL [Campylobacterales bacterium]
MSNKEKTEPEHGEVKEKKPNNMLMIIIIVVLVLIIAIGGVVTMLLMGGKEEAAKDGHEAPAHEKPAEKPAESSHKSSASTGESTGDSRLLHDIGILFPLDAFTVNLKSDTGRRYLKATMALEIEGKELVHELTLKAPVIRDKIIRILSSKSLEEISSIKGKQKVSDEIMESLNAMIKDGKIKGIYFTEFILQ